MRPVIFCFSGIRFRLLPEPVFPIATSVFKICAFYFSFSLGLFLGLQNTARNFSDILLSYFGFYLFLVLFSFIYLFIYFRLECGFDWL